MFAKIAAPIVMPLAYGSWHYFQGNYEAAELWSDQSLIARPSFFAYFLKASANLKRQDFRKAELDFSQALDLKPDLVDAYKGRALARLNLNDVQGVIDDFSRVIEMKPQDPDAYFMRGHMLSKQGKSREAYLDLYRAAALYRADQKNALAEKADHLANKLMDLYGKSIEKGLSPKDVNSKSKTG
ncbi:MAG: tetratricopeptide repeat protein [Candidatus Caenarcaniphilales bacterium]|nr:tetratricopeptide repeat protein [Candidatus Caenarcaniphilales bacterium]